MVNDQHGHAVGDEVLRRIGSVLAAVVAGRGTAARIGGDEFAVLVDQASEAQARDIAAEILAVVGAPLTVVEGLVVRVTASVGIAFLRQETKPYVVLRQADLAMYRAKALGPGRAVVYRDDMADWMLARKQQVDLLAYQVELLRRENEALAQAATIDQRTGLPNPAAFDAEHARQHDAGTPYSLLLVDIDHFHSYNTTYRYLAGHQTLREVGQTIAQAVRAGDLTYRYGGEEFTVLLPNTDLRAAMTIAERIRLAVAELGIEHRGNPGGVVTVSIGVVEVGRGTTVTEAVEEASVAVLQAKDSGRNRVTGRLCHAESST
jgi:diguanylate cyclase (GGDEF)-like protein